MVASCRKQLTLCVQRQRVARLDHETRADYPSPHSHTQNCSRSQNPLRRISYNPTRWTLMCTVTHAPPRYETPIAKLYRLTPAHSLSSNCSVITQTSSALPLNYNESCTATRRRCESRPPTSDNASGRALMSFESKNVHLRCKHQWGLAVLDTIYLFLP